MVSFKEATKEFESLVEQTMNTITESVLPLQKKGFICCVSCFDEDTKDINRINNCIQKCQSPSEAFADCLRQEIQTLQSHISACQEACNNKHSMAYASSKNEQARQDIQSKIEKCTANCFVDSSSQLADIKKRMLDLLKKEK